MISMKTRKRKVPGLFFPFIEVRGTRLMEDRFKKRLQEIGRIIEEQGNEILEKVGEEAQAIGKQAKDSIEKARKKTEEILNASQEIESLKSRLQAVEERQVRLSGEISGLARLMGEILTKLREKQ
jgi:seryl-tRNA synthetase